MSYEDILNENAANIERPKPLPTGTYLMSIEDRPEFQEDVGQNNLPVVNFTFKVKNPVEGVDPEQLSAVGNVAGRSVRHTFWLMSKEGEKTLWRLKAFLEDTLKIEGDDRKLIDMLNDAVGKALLVTIEHRVVNRGDSVEVYPQVKSTAPA